MAFTPSPLNASQQAAIARLFSPTVIRDLACKGRSPLLARLISELTNVGLAGHGDTLARLFDAGFSALQATNYRTEYIYKAAIAHRILLGIHSLQTSVMLTEFRVGNCK